MNDDYSENWLNGYESRSQYYSEAANLYRKNQEPAQPIEIDIEETIETSNLSERVTPGYEPVPSPTEEGVRPEPTDDGMVSSIMDIVHPQRDRDNDFMEGVTGFVKDVARPLMENPVARGVAGGVRDAAQGVLDLGQDMEGVGHLGYISYGPEGFSFDEEKPEGIETVSIPEIPRGEGAPETLVRGLTQFMTVFAGAGGMKKGASLLKQITAGGIADASFDPELGNLSTFLRELDVDNELTQYLDSKVGEDADSEERLMARAKQALEGAGLAMIAPPLVGALKWARAQNYDTQIRQLLDKGSEIATGGIVKKMPIEAEMVSYHGSPHKFDKFSSENIGTGEGAQAYGHGLYFAENKGVAESYKQAIPHADVKRSFLDALPEDAEIDEVMELIGKGHFSESQESVLKALDADDWLGFDYPSQAISASYKNLDNFDPSPALRAAIDDTSHLYEVDIPDEHIKSFLDWDAPLSEQSDSVKKALKKSGNKTIIEAMDTQPISHEDGDYWSYMGNTYDSRLEALQDFTGENIMRGISPIAKGPEESSKLLNSIGIKGIKYFDGSSRAGKEGTRNLVVFDDSIIEMKTVNGKPVKKGDVPRGEPKVKSSTKPKRDNKGRFTK